MEANRVGKERIEFGCSMEHHVENIEGLLGQLLRNATYTWDNPLLRDYIEGVLTYAKAQTEAFLTLFKSSNYIGASSFPRLLADCCLRTYVLRLWNEIDLTDYLQRYFDNREPEKKKYNGKELKSQWKDLLKVDYPVVYDIFQESNKSVHLSRFHYHDFVQQKGTNDGSYMGKFSDEGKRKMMNDMANLLICLGNIINEIGDSSHFGAPLEKEAKLGTVPMGWGLVGWVRLDKLWEYLSQTYLQQGLGMMKQHDLKSRAMGKGTLADVNFDTHELEGVNRLKDWYDLFCMITTYLTQEEGEGALQRYEAFWVFDVDFGTKKYAHLPVLDVSPFDWDGGDNHVRIGCYREVK